MDSSALLNQQPDLNTESNQIEKHTSDNFIIQAALWRNITMEFSRNDTVQKYGVKFFNLKLHFIHVNHHQVSKISAVYEVKQFVVVKNETDPVTNEVILC